MDVDKLLSAAIRFSNFMTIRLVFFSIFVWTTMPVLGVPTITQESILKSLPVVETAILSYKNTIEAVGIDDVAIYLLLFVFITVIHLTFTIAVRIGQHLPLDLVMPSLSNLKRNMTMEIFGIVRELDLTGDERGELKKKIMEVRDDPQILGSSAPVAIREIFALLKFSVVYLVILKLFVPDELQIGAFYSQFWTCFFLVLLCCLLYAYRQYAVSHNRYIQIISEIDEATVGLISSHHTTESQRKYRSLVAANYSRFEMKYDWNVPFVGSLRVYLERRQEKKLAES